MSSQFFTFLFSTQNFKGATAFKRKSSQFTIILFCLLFFVVESKCPSSCSCTPSAILCMNQNLGNIPDLEDIEEEDPLTIDLSGNKISIIGPTDLNFKKSHMVKELYLNDTGLIDIDGEAFTEMKNLQELYLSNNLLNSLPPDFIEHLRDLIALDLSGNYFEGAMPKIKSRSLEVLTIINCQLTSFKTNSLKHLPNLKLLSLQQNNIHKIDMFGPISNKWLLLKLPYKTWTCNCKTILGLNYLAQNKYIDDSEPYECKDNYNYYKMFKFYDMEQLFCKHNEHKRIKNIFSQKSENNNILEISDETENKIKKDIHENTYLIETQITKGKVEINNDSNKFHPFGNKFGFESNEYEYYEVEYFICVFTIVIIGLAVAIILSSLLFSVNRTNNDRHNYVTI